MRHWACVLGYVVSSCVLMACSTTPRVEQPASLLDDSRFAPQTERIRAADVFALSDEMKRYLATDIAAQLSTSGRRHGLIEALYSRRQLKLEYDSVLTRNAAQAFEARAGNCLSLVIMTAAFASQLGLPVHYQSADDDAVWSRSAGLVLRSNHVNLTLDSRLTNVGTRYEQSPLTVDFLPADEIRGLRTRPISEATVVAMYMNNRAAETLAQGRVDDAYWWAREAIVQDPSFLAAVNTLGVIYRRHGDLAQAESALRFVLAREPGNTRAMSNLAHALGLQGRDAEAAALTAELARIEPYPPFHFYDLGQQAMQRHDFVAARELFAREVARADYSHEFHFWLAVANFKLGDTLEAQKQLGLALDNSPGKGVRERYAAKLAWLRAQPQP